MRLDLKFATLTFCNPCLKIVPSEKHLIIVVSAAFKKYSRCVLGVAGLKRAGMW
jgi:hypothetical protein